MTTKQKAIIRLWDKPITIKRRLTYSEIAHEVGVGRSYVFKTIKKYRKQSNEPNSGTTN